MEEMGALDLVATRRDGGKTDIDAAAFGHFDLALLDQGLVGGVDADGGKELCALKIMHARSLIAQVQRIMLALLEVDRVGLEGDIGKLDVHVSRIIGGSGAGEAAVP